MAVYKFYVHRVVKASEQGCVDVRFAYNCLDAQDGERQVRASYNDEERAQIKHVNPYLIKRSV